jgi:ribosome-binding protein aMBF1 (putative translation factor)
MGEFAAGLRQRIRETRTALRRAMESQDSYAVQIEQSELEDLLRIATEHGVEEAGAELPNNSMGDRVKVA